MPRLQGTTIPFLHIHIHGNFKTVSASSIIADSHAQRDTFCNPAFRSVICRRSLLLWALVGHSRIPPAALVCRNTGLPGLAFSPATEMPSSVGALVPSVANSSRCVC